MDRCAYVLRGQQNVILTTHRKLYMISLGSCSRCIIFGLPLSSFYLQQSLHIALLAFAKCQIVNQGSIEVIAALVSPTT